MYRTLAFIHTSSMLVGMFSELAKQYLPGMGVFHMTDESLVRETIAARKLTTTTTRRLAAMIHSAQEGGADAVMVTCSSIGAAVPIARQLFDFPILRVDEAMAETAVARATRIGVGATLATTLEPTIELLRETAAAAGRTVQVIPCLCEGAFAAIQKGDTERHDRILSDALKELVREVELVVLAQASMARVLPSLPPHPTPVLSSPELAMRQAARILLDHPCAATG